MSAHPLRREEARLDSASKGEPSSRRERALAEALIEVLAADPAILARLLEIAELQRPPAVTPIAPVYTVGTLAAALQVSEKVVRGAIGRGELAAVKRGGRWIIGAAAVDEWARRPSDGFRVARSVRRRAGADRPLGSAIARLPGSKLAD